MTAPGAADGAALAVVYPPAMKSLATWFRRGRLERSRAQPLVALRSGDA